MANISERSNVFGDIYGELIGDVGDGCTYMEYDPQSYGAWEVGAKLEGDHVVMYGTSGDYGFTCEMETIVFVNTSYDEMEKYLNSQIYYNAVLL